VTSESVTELGHSIGGSLLPLPLGSFNGPEKCLIS